MRNPEQLLEDIHKVLSAVDDLVREMEGETPANGAPNGVNAIISGVRAKVSELKGALVDRVHDTDQRVHDNAWKLIGTAALIAFAAGLLIAGTNRSTSESSRL
jgi:ElaB/YqjD/DUF883 family membrane-anchored ribosome-binding protein